MKLAYFGHKPQPGGKGGGLVSYSTEILRGLRARGLDIVFMYHGPRTRHRRDSKEIQIGALNIMNRSVISTPNARELIEDTLRAERPQIAHASLSFSQLLDFSLPDICHAAGIPIVATLHFPYDRRTTFWGSASRSLYRVYASPLAKYDGIIVFSSEQSALLADYGVPAENIHVIPNGVDVGKYAPGPATYKRDVNADYLITYMGRVDPEKNVDTLLKVFSDMRVPPTHRLVVVGDGSELDRLRERFAAYTQIEFMGWVASDEQRVRILQATDMFVLPSDVEGLSLAMLEAMACGCTVIATDAGADGEALGDAGILIDPESLEPQLRLAMQVLIAYPEFARSLAGRARARAVTYYSLDANVGRLVELYGRMLGTAPARAG
ncbi:MAG: glycosyltransferase family 4 protein [Chloroflexi bacterium]|nr:glycosyltransferase family 4 protein [Chloroflexota bacterium]